MVCGIVYEYGRGWISHISRKIMYKSILLTDKELELLGSIVSSYLANKEHKNDHNLINAHILLRVISSKKPNEERNQLAFFGKSG